MRKSIKKFFSKLIRSKPVLSIIAWLSRFAFELLHRTLRVQYEGIQTLPDTSIIALWHNRLILAPLVTKRFPHMHFTVVVSKSRDGLYLSTFAKTFRWIKIIQVSHKSRNIALLEIVQELKNKTALIITPDGPRGPKCSIKPGLSFSAIRAQVPIVVMRWHASSFWQLNTWDEMQIPKPFSKVTVSFSEPIAPGRSAKELEKSVLENL